MLLQFKERSLNILQAISRSIAFLPSLLILCFIGLAVIIIEVEYWEIGSWLSQKLGNFVIRDADTSRVVLSTIIGGLFTLVVFTFSMVMLLLNQASNSYSPRLLPGLISNKKHQLILGFFIGTIVYSLCIIIQVLPEAEDHKVPGLAVLACLIFGQLCLALFIYFLHSISKAIQIGHILKKLYIETSRQLEIKIQESAEDSKVEYKDFDDSSSFDILNQQTGYVQSINGDSLLELACDWETDIQVLVPRGSFVSIGEAILRVSKKPEEAMANEMLSCLNFDPEEVISMNFNLGFKQITEIILKAMSPGINDPSTAITALNYLSDLFRILLQIPEQQILSKSKGQAKVFISYLSFESVLYFTMSSIRPYIKHDPQVILSSLDIFRILLNVQDLDPAKKKIIEVELTALLADVSQHIKNERDLMKIRGKLSKIDPSKSIHTS